MKIISVLSFVVVVLFCLSFPLVGVAQEFCDSESDCDDSNPCTSDDCATFVCVHTLEPSGSHVEDCDDGVFCNGTEGGCFLGVCVSGSPPDCDDDIQCTTDDCSELQRVCSHNAPDVDGDGHGDINCEGLGDDCDDTDPNRFPGHLEVCDSDDEDCDPETFGNRDQDGDGFVDSACCADSNCGDDCDDMEPSIHPIQNEVCNGVDDDCDGDIDMASEGVGGSLTKLHFPDSDGDGYGDPATSFALCPGEPGFSMLGNDCDDTKPAIFPGAMICGAPANPTNVMVCMSDGTFALGSCDPSTKSFCVMQPNGTGICLPKKG